MNIVQHHVILNGEQQGPFTIGQLRRMWEAGQVNLQTQHFMDGYTEWMPLGFIREDLEEQSIATRPAAYHPMPSQIVTVRKSRGVFIILGLFFFGLFGAHNFYAGYHGRGVAQLLVTLFTGWMILPLFVVAIWIIIELLAVDKDANGVKMH